MKVRRLGHTQILEGCRDSDHGKAGRRDSFPPGSEKHAAATAIIALALMGLLALPAAGRQNELGKRYVRRLRDQETQFDQLNALIPDLRRSAEDQRKKLQGYSASLDVE